MKLNHNKISCIKLVHLLYLYIWCTVTLISNSSWCFEGNYRLNLRGYDFVKAVHFFKTREKITQSHNETTIKTCFSTITQEKPAITVFVLLCTYFSLFYLPHLLLGFADARLLFSDLMKRQCCHNVWMQISTKT